MESAGGRCMSKPYSIEFEMEGLSFAARAVLATVTALTYEFQESEIRDLVVMRALGMSAEAFSAAFDELHEAGRMYRSGPHTNFDCVTIMSSFEVLSQAMGAGGRPTQKEWAELRAITYEVHGKYCTYCLDTRGPFAIDHIIPVTKGGSNHRENLVPACQSCNTLKGNKSWGEWYPIMMAIRDRHHRQSARVRGGAA